jgi:signal transduction histidine kinase
MAETSLFQLVEEVAQEEARGKPLPVSIQGPKDLSVVVDPNLLRIAISNAIRNALEANAVGGRASPVVVTFGQTELDYWITVLDSGPGIAGPSEAAFEFGRTTKSGHRGFGLALTRQALMTLDGTVSLQPAQTGGARLEMRWYK